MSAQTRPVSDILSNSSHARNIARMDLGLGYAAAIWTNHDDHVTYDAPKGHTFSYYLRGGEGTWRRDGTPVHGWPGAVCVMPQGQSSTWEINQPFTFLHLYVPDEELRRTYAETFDMDARRIELADRSFVQAGCLEAPFRSLLAAMHSGDAAQADAARVELLASVLGGPDFASDTRHALTGGLSSRHVRQLRDYVEDNLDQALTLRDLSQLVGLSEFHLQRSFRKTCGVSPQKWIMHRRITRAKQMIRGGEPLAQVAAAAGFSSQSHMSRAFRDSLGTTPGAFRRGLSSERDRRGAGPG